MKVNGNITKRMDTEYKVILMEKNILVNLKIMSITAKEHKLLSKEINLLENLKMV